MGCDNFDAEYILPLPSFISVRKYEEIMLVLSTYSHNATPTGVRLQDLSIFTWLKFVQLVHITIVKSVVDVLYGYST